MGKRAATWHEPGSMPPADPPPHVPISLKDDDTLMSTSRLTTFRGGGSSSVKSRCREAGLQKLNGHRHALVKHFARGGGSESEICSRIFWWRAGGSPLSGGQQALSLLSHVGTSCLLAEPAAKDPPRMTTCICRFLGSGRSVLGIHSGDLNSV